MSSSAPSSSRPWASRDDMIRLSVGLEAPADITADLDRALQRLAEGLSACSPTSRPTAGRTRHGAPTVLLCPWRRHGPLRLGAAGPPLRLPRLERARDRPAGPRPSRELPPLASIEAMADCVAELIERRRRPPPWSATPWARWRRSPQPRAILIGSPLCALLGAALTDAGPSRAARAGRRPRR